MTVYHFLSLLLGGLVQRAYLLFKAVIYLNSSNDQFEY